MNLKNIFFILNFVIVCIWDGEYIWVRMILKVRKVYGVKNDE